MIEQKNWLEIYQPWERWQTGQGELPRVQVGSRVTPSSLLMKDGRTTPPQPISEPELITLMDKCGIGTDATIAQHIATIQERDYATKNHNQRFLPTPLGIALIQGYNSMGYQLNKPDLRRETERECNLVANRQKTKADIVGPILEKMKECYIVATRDAHKLDEAMARHFQRVGVGNDTVMVQARFTECGRCHNMMDLKKEQGGGRGNNDARTILFCNTCQEGYVMPRKGKPRPKIDDANNDSSRVKCPICNFQVVSIARGDGYDGNGYDICPKCYVDPPAEYGGGRNGGNLPCFSCSHPTCALAGGTPGGDIEAFGCPFCREHQVQGGKVTLKKNSRGYVLSCTNYSSRHRCGYTIWLPKASQNISIPDDDGSICNVCSTFGPVRKVSFVWKVGGVPPHIGRESTVCILCDSQFRQDVGILLPQMNQVRPSTTAVNRGRGGGSGGTRRNQTWNNNNNNNNNRQRSTGNNGNNAYKCFKCGQPGHFSNNCPTARQ
jgi:DNA topoisomerase-3